MHATRFAGLALAGGLALALSPAEAGKLLLSANDGKYPVKAEGGGYQVADPAPADSLTVIDVSVFPPKAVGEIQVLHSVAAPPFAVALSPDETLALVSAPAMIDAADKTKLAPQKFIQVIPLDAGKPGAVSKLELPSHPVGVSFNDKGDLALAAHFDGKVSVLAVSGGDVKLVETITVGDDRSRAAHAAITPDGKWALVPKQETNSIAVLQIDGTKVTKLDREISVGLRPYGLEIAADGRYAAVANIGRGLGDNDSVSIVDLTRQPFRQVDIFTVPQTPEGIAVSPDGKWIAVASMNGSNKAKGSPFRNETGLLLLYAVDDMKARFASQATIGRNAQGVIFTPDGKHLAVQQYADSDLAFYSIEEGGKLKDTGHRIKTAGYPAAFAKASR